MPNRYKIRFPDGDSYEAAQQEIGTGGAEARHTMKSAALVQATDLGGPMAVVHNSKRNTLTLELPDQLAATRASQQLDSYLENLSKNFGGEVVPDFQYSNGFEDINDPVPAEHVSHAMFAEADTAPAQSPSLDDVLGLIHAEEAWQTSTGEDITIAVVDTGVSGSRPEFPQSKRVGQWQPLNDNAWIDTNGHGSMCACIATGTKADAGVYNGVAPGANLISCKTSFYDSELAAIYDYLNDLVTNQGMNIVTTNSFGWSSNTPPADDSDSDFIPALSDAIDAGVKVVFAAGNDHQKVGGKPDSCSPNSIWLSYKSRADVLIVATCTPVLQMWFNSSRGPGQYFGQPNTSSKPDVTAPTPANGWVVYGDIVKSVLMWGTSGAGPQVAGLAALLLSHSPNLSRDDLFAAIRASGEPLASAYGPTCAGTGIINCAKALNSL